MTNEHTPTGADKYACSRTCTRGDKRLSAQKRLKGLCRACRVRLIERVVAFVCSEADSTGGEA